MLEWFGRFCIVFIAIYFYLWLLGVEATGPQVFIYAYVFYHVFQDSLE
jgi:hypothetical protein